MTKTEEREMRKAKEKLLYYGFWLWEYQRRNSEYVSDYKIYKAVEDKSITSHVVFVKFGGKSYSVPGELKKEWGTFFEKHRRPPKDPNAAGVLTSEELLTDIFSGDFFCEIDDVFDIEAFQHKKGNLATKVRSASLEPQETNIISLDINLEHPWGQIQLETMLAYYRYRTWGTSLETILLGKESENPDEIGLLRASLLLMDLLRKEPDKKMKPINLPRAVGLWIWDYTKINGCDFMTACDKFTHVFESEIKGTQFDHVSRVKKVYQTTEECINQVELLPISGK